MSLRRLVWQCGRWRGAEMFLTVEHHSHLGLEVIVRELPEGEGLPGCILQHTEGEADGVLWRETRWVDEPGGKDGMILSV